VMHYLIYNREVILMLMARYIVHLRNNGFNAKNAADLLLRAGNLADDNAIIRDSRVSSKYVEFDITIASEKLDNLLLKLSKISPVVNTIEIVDKERGKENAIEYAKSLFNDERYWECHEALEGVWKKEVGDEKNLLQGIILTCAAFVHSQKDEDDICLSILGRAMEKLQSVTGIYYGIDMDRFKKQVLNIMDAKNAQYFKI